MKEKIERANELILKRLKEYFPIGFESSLQDIATDILNILSDENLISPEVFSSENEGEVSPVDKEILLNHVCRLVSVKINEAERVIGEYYKDIEERVEALEKKLEGE